MKNTSFLRNGVIIVAASLLTFTSCKRNKTEATPALTSADDNGGYASDGAKLEQHNNDVISIADMAASSGSANLRVTSVYPIVTHDTLSSPHLLTIDYGTGGVSGIDGKVRRGMIIVTYSGRYKDSGSVHTITTSNYFVNDHQVIAHKTVTNKGTNTDGNVWYTVSVNDSVILANDSVISWTASRTRTWLAGYSSATRYDDVYQIKGTSILKRANGHIFTATIPETDPLKVAVNCANIEAGTVIISSTSFTGGDRELNYTYGGGSCDDLASLTIGTHVYIITLH